MFDCKSNTEITKRKKKKEKTKNPALKQTQTKKDAGLENKNKNNKSLSDISVQSVKQSFLAAPRGRHQMWNSSPLLELNKQTNKKNREHVCYALNKMSRAVRPIPSFLQVQT